MSNTNIKDYQLAIMCLANLCSETQNRLIEMAVDNKPLSSVRLRIHVNTVRTLIDALTEVLGIEPHVYEPRAFSSTLALQQAVRLKDLHRQASDMLSDEVVGSLAMLEAGPTRVAADRLRETALGYLHTLSL